MDRYNIYVHVLYKSRKPRENSNAADISVIILSGGEKFNYGTNLQRTTTWSSRHSYLCCVIKIWKLTPGFKHRLEMAV